MTKKSIGKHPPLSAWQAGILRLTAFPAPNTQLSDQNWWADVVGEYPETRTSQPRTGEQSDKGIYNKGTLLLTVHPIRIDWRFGMELQSVEPAAKLEELTLGSFPDALESFLELMEHWFNIETTPRLVRLAFGAILLQPVGSTADAYNLLSNYLPYKFKLEDARDFLYQINRPRFALTNVPKLKINRLCKWSAHLTQLEILPIGTASVTYRTPELHAARLELDINTEAEFDGELEREMLSQLFRELVELGKEIAVQGDIP